MAYSYALLILPLSFVFNRGLDAGSPQAKITSQEELVCLVAKQLLEVLPVREDVPAGVDTNRRQFTLKNPPDAVHLAT
jgi:hypothetical protein